MILNSIVTNKPKAHAVFCSNFRGFYVSVNGKSKQFNRSDYVNAEQTAEAYYLKAEMELIRQSNFE
jgi:hypothetical protein